VNADKDDHYVPSLPRASDSRSRVYSGHLVISESKHIHYIYTESQGDPQTDPVIFFTNGGPGCSGMIGFFTEIGPWRPIDGGDDGVYLVDNPYAWNRFANVVFVEQPVGVGFSYSSVPYSDYGDDTAAEDNLLTIEAFFNIFPERQSNDLFLASESYGGHYIPQLALRLLDSQLSVRSRLRGILVGNPWVSFGSGFVARAHAFWGYQLIPAPLWEEFSSSSCLSMDVEIAEYPVHCIELVESMFDVVGDALDYYGENFPVCVANIDSLADSLPEQETWLSPLRPSEPYTPSAPLLRLERTMGRIKNNGARNLRGRRRASEAEYDPCLASYMTEYLNAADVQAALHVLVPGRPSSTWSQCSDEILNAWPDSDYYENVAGLYGEIIQREEEVNVLVYSGDNDLVCPTIGTQHWVFDLSLQSENLWRPWYRVNQTAGYVSRFSGGFTLVTVHGAGHQAPAYQPGRSQDMVARFLSGEWFQAVEESRVLTVFYVIALTGQKWDRKDIWESGGVEFLKWTVRRVLQDVKGVDVWDVRVDDSTERNLGDDDVDYEVTEELNGGEYVVSVDLLVQDFQRGLELKPLLDSAFMFMASSGELKTLVNRALFAQLQRHHDSRGIIENWSEWRIRQVEGRYSAQYYADILVTTSRPDFEWPLYHNISWESTGTDDDEVADTGSDEYLLPFYKWRLDLDDIMIVVFLPIGIIISMLAVFKSYRHAHDKLISQWGYEIQYDHDDSGLLSISNRSFNSTGDAGGTREDRNIELVATHNPLAT